MTAGKTAKLKMQFLKTTLNGIPPFFEVNILDEDDKIIASLKDLYNQKALTFTEVNGDTYQIVDNDIYKKGKDNNFVKYKTIEEFSKEKKTYAIEISPTYSLNMQGTLDDFKLSEDFYICADNGQLYLGNKANNSNASFPGYQRIILPSYRNAIKYGDTIFTLDENGKLKHAKDKSSLGQEPSTDSLFVVSISDNKNPALFQGQMGNIEFLTIDPSLTPLNRDTVSKAIYLTVKDDELYLVKGTEELPLNLEHTSNTVEYNGNSYMLKGGKIVNGESEDLGTRVRLLESEESLQNFRSKFVESGQLDDVQTNDAATAEPQNGQQNNPETPSNESNTEKSTQQSPTASINTNSNQDQQLLPASTGDSTDDNTSKTQAFVDKFFTKTLTVSRWSSKASSESIDMFKQELVKAFNADAALAAKIPTTDEEQQLYANKILRALSQAQFNEPKGALFVDNIGRKNGANIFKTAKDFIVSLFSAIVYGDYSIFDNYLKNNPSVVVKDTEKFKTFLNAQEKPEPKDIAKGISNLTAAISSIEEGKVKGS